MNEASIFNDLFGTNGIFLDFKLEDCESIPLKPTAKALKFLVFAAEYMKYNNHCFWSGNNAKNKAHAFISDKDVDFISLLFRFWNTYNYDKTVSFAISRLYAMYSNLPEAIIFLSSDKPTEKTGLTMGTNFWEAELPVLLQLNFKIICFVDNHTGICYQDLISQKNITIYRRYAHPMDFNI